MGERKYRDESIIGMTNGSMFQLWVHYGKTELTVVGRVSNAMKVVLQFRW